MCVLYRHNTTVFKRAVTTMYVPGSHESTCGMCDKSGVASIYDISRSVHSIK